MARRISVRQMRRWVAFYRVEPFGNDWRRTARQTVVLAGAAGAKLHEDAEEMFLPGYDPNRPQTEEEMLRELQKIPAAFRKGGG
jgi:hypothetical protein